MELFSVNSEPQIISLKIVMFDREFIFPSSLGNSMSDHPGYDPPYITYFFQTFTVDGYRKNFKNPENFKF